MKYLNYKAGQVFRKVVEHLKGKDHSKIVNAPGAFIPLTVEKLWKSSIGPVYSLCHYLKHDSGDLLKDPDMTFVVTKDGICPLEWQNNLAGMYTEAAIIEKGKLVIQSERDYNSLVSFAETWMRNLAEQQGLGAKRA